jgi:hypothetical protein
MEELLVTTTAGITESGSGSGTSIPGGARSGSPMLMLALATIGFAVNFWAWALISPLGPMFRDSGALGVLSESDVALMVAVPVLVGSVFSAPLGYLTRPYIVYRRRDDAQLGSHRPRRGWDRVDDRHV